MKKPFLLILLLSLSLYFSFKSSASECTFVSSPPDEPSEILVFYEKNGVKRFSTYVDGLNEETHCDYSVGWPGTLGDEDKYASRYIFYCEGGYTWGTLSFVSSKNDKKDDIIVLNGLPFYADCAFSK
jgi:hypothetical protein